MSQTNYGTDIPLMATVVPPLLPSPPNCCNDHTDHTVTVSGRRELWYWAVQGWTTRSSHPSKVFRRYIGLTTVTPCWPVDCLLARARECGRSTLCTFRSDNAKGKLRGRAAVRVPNTPTGQYTNRLWGSQVMITEKLSDFFSGPSKIFQASSS